MRATYESPATQGWVLNELWKSEDGLQKNSSSILSIRYSTGDGLKLNGICSNKEVRSALLALVLIDASCIDSINVADIETANKLLKGSRLNFVYDNRETNVVNWQEI